MTHFLKGSSCAVFPNNQMFKHLFSEIHFHKRKVKSVKSKNGLVIFLSTLNSSKLRVPTVRTVKIGDVEG